MGSDLADAFVDVISILQKTCHLQRFLFKNEQTPEAIAECNRSINSTDSG
jgi:hypothetical protein